MLRAAQLAVNQINANRGIRGRKVELRILDDSGNEDTAVRVAEQLYADPTVVAVVGHLSSGASLAAARVYGGGATPTPMISPSASSPDLSGISPYVFRVCPSDLQHGPQLARFAWQTLGARRAGIIYLNNDYGRGVRRTFAAEFARLGGTVLETDPYIPATPSFEPYFSRMRRSGADVLLLAAERPGAELALREMQSLGLRWPVLGGDALTGIEADGALAEGIRLSSAVTSATSRSSRTTRARSRDSGPTIAAPGRTTSCCCSRARSTGRAPTGAPFGTTSRAWVAGRRRSRGSPARSRSTVRVTRRVRQRSSASCGTVGW